MMYNLDIGYPPGETTLTRAFIPAGIFLVLLFASNAATAQLLGLEHYLAPPKVDYSADVTMTYSADASGGMESGGIQGRVTRARDKERRELTIEGDVEILIIRLDRNIVWSVSPEEKMYLESPLDEALGRTPDADGKLREPAINLKTIGSEAVDGIPATKQRITGKDVDGSPIAGTVRVSGQGIVLRVDSDVVDEDGKHHTVRMELHNVQVGPQDPALFEIPADYKRVSPSRLGLNTPIEGDRTRHSECA